MSVCYDKEMVIYKAFYKYRMLALFYISMVPVDMSGYNGAIKY